jgi:hypothetical protein
MLHLCSLYFQLLDVSKIEAFEERLFFGFPELSLDFLSSSYWVEFSKCRRVPSTYNHPISYIIMYLVYIDAFSPAVSKSEIGTETRFETSNEKVNVK